MNGITILNTTLVTVMDTGWITFLVFGIPLFIIGAFMWILDECNRMTGFIMTMIGIVFIGIFGLGYFIYPEHDTYQVIIDETVKFSEFTAQYEILDQEGLIYTVKER